MNENSELEKFYAMTQHFIKLIKIGNYDEIYFWLSKDGNFRSIPFPVSTTAIVYRSRVHKEKELGKYFTKAADLGYNRKSKALDYGRCNKKGQAVGYFSEKPFAAVLETIPNAKAGEVFEVTLSAWEITADLMLYCLVESNPQRRKYYHEYEDILGKWYDKEMEKFEAEVVELFNHYFAFFNAKMTSIDKHEYVLTAAYANKCYEISNGIAYSSVVSCDSYNVALNNSVEDDKKIQLQNICKIRFEVLKNNPQTEEHIRVEYLKNCIGIQIDREACLWDEPDVCLLL